jgi:serine/threonine protein kinase
VESQRRTGTGRPLRPDDPERVGSYTILGRIGEGGMGAVYLGRGPDGRQVAIKVVRPELAHDPGFVARFREEVTNAQRVASFCTAQVLDHGESADRAYMVTEYIDGVSLKDYVKEHGELSPGMLQGVAVGVAAALVAIHAAGLIHRDLKPANVMLSYSGPRVIDFGIARALDVATGLTMTGQLVGSPGWMAPERILQQQVTTAADIFSWGCLVAFGQTGVNPFGTGDFSVMSARLLHGDPQVGHLPSPLDRLVRAALDKDPRNRPTARDLLLTMVGGESSEAAVLGTLTAWQSPVPLAPRGATRVMGESTQEAPSPAGPPPAGPPAGSPPASARGAGPPTVFGDRPPTPHEAGPPTAYGEGPPTAYGGGPVPRGAGAFGSGPATVAAGSPVESPTRPSGPGARPPSGPPPTPSGQPRQGRGGRRAALAGAVAVVLAAGAVTGWLVFRPEDKKAAGTATTASKGPAPLPSDPLVVRIDRQSGWPAKCYGSIGKLIPTTATVSYVLPGNTTCDILPRWSPDRKKIAFTRSTSAALNELWVMNANGSGPAMVTNQMAGRSRVAWSPDGKRIAFVAKVGTGRQIDEVTVAAPHSTLQLTSDDTFKDDPAWCGSRVAFWTRSTGGLQTIFTVDAATPGKGRVQVTHADNDVNDPSFSPDCKQMAYTDQPSKDARHIWITTADGKGTPHQLTSDGTRDMDATWSPDGTWIAVARGATELPSIWAVRVADRHEQRISPPQKYMAHPDWS